jgi:hypothetical protein
MLSMLAIRPDTMVLMYIMAGWFTALAIGIARGIKRITIPDRSPGDLEYTITRGPDGDSAMALAMDGSASAGILTIAVGGGHVDIDMDTGMDIIGDISMGTDKDIDMAMLRAEGPDT